MAKMPKEITLFEAEAAQAALLAGLDRAHELVCEARLKVKLEAEEAKPPNPVP